MGKASRETRRRSSAALNPNKAKGIPLPWISVAVVVVVLGVFVIIVSRGGSDTAPIANKDHWHAAIGVNVCGTYAPDAPEFELRAGSSTLTAGIHSHGNGLMHIHPHVSSEAGDNATVGRFFEYGGWPLDATGFKIWTGEEKHNGDECPDGKKGKLVWSVQHLGDDKPTFRKGNPADYKPKNGDIIAIGFLTEGQHLGTPPSAAAIATPGDVPGSPSITFAPGATTAPAATTAPGATSEPAATPTTAAAGTTTP